jgi:hypothetical protein
VREMLPLLATYLGHGLYTDTAYYVTAGARRLYEPMASCASINSWSWISIIQSSLADQPLFFNHRPMWANHHRELLPSH